MGIKNAQDENLVKRVIDNKFLLTLYHEGPPAERTEQPLTSQEFLGAFSIFITNQILQ